MLFDQLADKISQFAKNPFKSGFANIDVGNCPLICPLATATGANRANLQRIKTKMGFATVLCVYLVCYNSVVYIVYCNTGSREVSYNYTVHTHTTHNNDCIYGHEQAPVVTSTHHLFDPIVKTRSSNMVKHWQTKQKNWKWNELKKKSCYKDFITFEQGEKIYLLSSGEVVYILFWGSKIAVKL